MLKPIYLCRNEQEKCIIESSINSVRISFSVKKNQLIEELISKMLERFLSLRADKFAIMRKKCAHEGYDFSFLITDEHLRDYRKEDLLNFIIEFIQGIDKEINEMKLSIIHQARLASTYYANAVANNKI